MTTIYAAILTLCGMNFRRSEMKRFENIKTSVAERPIPSPFAMLVVTASVGHIPST